MKKAQGAVNNHRRLVKECLPILSSIFVKWRWLVTALLTITLAFGGLSFHTGKVIENLSGKIIKNTFSFEILEQQITKLEKKIDILIVIVREKKVKNVISDNSK